MDKALIQKINKTLGSRARIGPFCVSGSVPITSPGLEVNELGPVKLPLRKTPANKLRRHCEQAPYGKGTETLVDRSVRNVWHLKPKQFSLANPAWDEVVNQIVSKVQAGLGLGTQKVVPHLYDLLLYETGGFFAKHKDGEKLDRMVATLVIVLPAEHNGGELVVYHDGKKETVDFAKMPTNQIHYAAFYADCEHEVKRLDDGNRLCLVYNLALASSPKAAKKQDAVDQIEALVANLQEWSKNESPRKLAVTLKHQYTENGLDWDTLKGGDRDTAELLVEAALRADCRVYLGLLTFHELGGGHSKYGDDYDNRGRWYNRYEDEDEDFKDEDETDDSETEDDAAFVSKYVMDDIIESSLDLTKAKDHLGKAMPFEELSLDEDDLLDTDALRAVKPKETYEGYTGNEGMTLERWYRHAAIVIWPERSHYHVVCDQNLHAGMQMLGKLIAQWQKASAKHVAEKLDECIRLARAIIDCWRPVRISYYDRDKLRVDPFFPLLNELDNPSLIAGYITKVMAPDVSLDPGAALAKACEKQGWPTFAPALTALFQGGNAESLLRNAHVLEYFGCAKSRKREGRHSLCEALGQAYLTTLEKDDAATAISPWREANKNRIVMLAGLIRAFLAGEQAALLTRLVQHILAMPSHYPLGEVQLPALEKVQSWLKKNLHEPSMPMSTWIAQCGAKLEEATAEMPLELTDFRRSASAKCSCKWCEELNRFLADPQEEVHRLKANEGYRQHVEGTIRDGSCDVDCATDKNTSPHTLVCKKNLKSYHAALKKYHENLKRLEKVRAIEATLPV